MTYSLRPLQVPRLYGLPSRPDGAPPLRLAGDVVAGFGRGELAELGCCNADEGLHGNI